MAHRRLDLKAWLATLDQRPSFLLGGTGHLLLAADEETRAAAHLEQRLLPSLFRDRRPAHVTIATGLAPGADLLFERVVGDWLREARIPFATVALLPVPIDVLIGDWVLMAHDRDRAPSATTIATICAEIAAREASCEVVVDLLPAGFDHTALRTEDIRREQYRRLAACLAEQSDLLVALLRAQNLQQPGGTAEVVEWRRSPRLIPAEYSTLALRAQRGRRPLAVIDPALVLTADLPAPKAINGHA